MTDVKYKDEDDGKWKDTSTINFTEHYTEEGTNMARVRSVNLVFPPSGSPDVTGYKMYYVNTGEVLDYDSPVIDLGMPPVGADGDMRVDVSLIGVLTDGSYDLGFTSVDDAENESSMSTLLNVPFDFVAPDAPGPVRVEII